MRLISLERRRAMSINKMKKAIESIETSNLTIDEKDANIHLLNSDIFMKKQNHKISVPKDDANLCKA